MLNAGDLRHKIDIQQLVATQRDNGTWEHTWQTQWRVSAARKPLSASERIAAQAMQSEISENWVIRFIDGITAKHRIVHGSRIYNIRGVLVDPDSGIEYLTLPCSEGTNDG